MPQHVIVIGGGAAGIIAAITAAKGGAQVTLLEKTDRLGTKILISGGGKCNITHAGTMDQVLRAFRKNEASFLRGPFYRYRNEQILELLTNRGLKVYTREDGRVFPVDQTAKDVVRILEAEVREAGVRIRFHSQVDGIEAAAGRVSAVIVDGERMRAVSVILCTGGSSYPRSGTTGDGYAWVKALGHTIVPVTAALAPVETLIEGIGVSLRDVILRAMMDGKEIDRFRGDILFTHRGLSGPAVLEVSRAIAEAWQKGRHTLVADLYPKRKFDDLLSEAQGFKANYPNQMLRAMIEQDLPSAIVPYLMEQAGLDLNVKNQLVTKKQINLLVEAVKGFRLGEVVEVLLEKGEVVAGGVALDEVEPSTMRSRIVDGLYLAGEILDIAGPVGGYNLQAAWSTGFVAGFAATH